jgi:hypothetical protein
MINIYKKSRDHLSSVNESYAEHFVFAFFVSIRLIGAGLAVITHALIPAFFQYNGSKAVKSLHELFNNRNMNSKK